MQQIFKTKKSGLFYIFDDNINKATITKCIGYFNQGIFIGIQAVEKREMTGDNLETAREILLNCFTKVFEDNVIAKMKQHLKTL